MSPSHIIVTRPVSDSANALCAAIQQAGFNAVHFPTIAFELLPIHTASYQNQAFDMVIFNSPQAVNAYHQVFHAKNHHLEMKSIAAIGEGTARTIANQLSMTVSLVPSSDNWSAEGLIALTYFHSPNVLDKKIAVIRGEGGRELLENELSARGALVTPIILYRRILPPVDYSSLGMLITSQTIAAIICTSFESIRNLKVLAGDKFFSIVCNIPLIVVSLRIKTLAQNLGFRTIWVATNPSTNAIMTTIIQRLKNKDESNDGRNQ